MNNKANNLEIILDNCIFSMFEEGQSLAACLAQYPEQRDVLEPLLQISVRLRDARTVQPAPEFRQVAATRMHHLISAHPHRQPSGNPQTVRWPDWRTLFTTRRRPVWAGLVGFLLVFCLLLGTLTVSAAANTIPGEKLYPVKRLVERTQLALTVNNHKKSHLHLRLADKRLQETAELLVLNQNKLAEKTLRDFTGELASATVLLDVNSPLTSNNRYSLAQVMVDDLVQYERTLTLWQASLPAEMETAVLDAISTAQSGQKQAMLLLGEEFTPLLPITAPTTTPSSTSATTPTPSATAGQTTVLTETITAVPTAPPFPVTRSISLTPQWRIPPGWPDNCPDPSNWPEIWPDDCPIPPVLPTDWPTPPHGWPGVIETAVITQIVPILTTPPPDWPDTCPDLSDLIDGWPEDCPLPSDWDSELPTPPGEWPDPSEFWPPPEEEWSTPLPVPTAWPTNLPEIIDPPDNIEIPDIPVPEPPDLPDIPEPPGWPSPPENNNSGGISWP